MSKSKIKTARRFLWYSRNYYDSERTTRSNCELDVLHWAFDKVARKNSKKETGVVEEWLDSPPAQRSSAQCTIGSTVSGKKTSSCASSCSLPPCDFFLFPKLKHSLKGTHFQSIEDIQRKTMDLLKGFTQNDFQKCFHTWKERMQHCIETQENYLEGDNLQHK
jgi:predicted nucleotidyltransferase